MKYIGIDPDCKKSGVAFWDSSDREFEWFGTMHFPLLSDTLVHLAEKDVVIVIEAGWLIKKLNWHNFNPYTTYSIGRNHQVGMNLAEVCKHWGLKYQLIKPTTKKWTPVLCKKLTGIDIKNQDIIDAVKLVFGR